MTIKSLVLLRKAEQRDKNTFVLSVEVCLNLKLEFFVLAKAFFQQHMIVLSETVPIIHSKTSTNWGTKILTMVDRKKLKCRGNSTYSCNNHSWSYGRHNLFVRRRFGSNCFPEFKMAKSLEWTKNWFPWLKRQISNQASVSEINYCDSIRAWFCSMSLPSST